VLVYFLSLCLFAMLLSKLLHRCRQQTTDLSPAARPRHGWLIASLYLLFTLGIPLVNGAAARPALFAEHSLTVLALVAIVFLAMAVWKNRKKQRTCAGTEQLLIRSLNSGQAQGLPLQECPP
jgi:hypothetical protein